MEGIEIIGYKNDNCPGCPTLENVLYHLALGKLKYNCTVVEYEKIGIPGIGTDNFKLQASVAIIVVETPNPMDEKKVDIIKKQINLN